MINNKTRIISFLMAFILIFTFAFLSPLMVSQSQAALPAIVLSGNTLKIIAGVLASSGLVVAAGTTLSETDYGSSVEALTYVVYRTLNGAEKLALMALSVLDNIVEVPVALYNSIVNNAKKLFEDTPTLEEQGLTIKYSTLVPSDTTYPDLTVTSYRWPSNSKTRDFLKYDYKYLDMAEAIPFLSYDGSLVDGDTFSYEGITTNIFDLGEDFPIYTDNSTDGRVYISPDIQPYNFKAYYGSCYASCYVLQGDYHYFYFNTTSSGDLGCEFMIIDKSICPNINDYKFNTYLLDNSYSAQTTVTDIYDLQDNFIKQIILIRQHNGYGLDMLGGSYLKDTPTTYDTTIIVEEIPTDVVTNTDSTANVLTIPATTSGAIGLTSSDVNVGATDVPGTGEGTGTGETTGLLQKILDTLMALGDYILEGIKNIFMPDLDGIVAIKEAIEEKFSIIGELKEMIDDLLDILTNDNPEPPNIIIPLSKAEGNIDYGQDCIALDLSWYGRYKEVVDLFIIGFAYVFFIWRLYQRLPGIISGSDGINWSALSGKSEYSGSGNIGFKPGGGKK